MDARNQAGATAAQQPSRAVARARYVRVTPMKARRVVDLIRGRSAREALAVLEFAPQAASGPVSKVLASAYLAVLRLPLASCVRANASNASCVCSTGTALSASYSFLLTWRYL